MNTIEMDVVEFAILLPCWQVDALEDAAFKQGLSVGQLLQKLINASLSIAEF